jgi:hypothetical protein
VRRRQPKAIRIVATCAVVISGLLAWLAPAVPGTHGGIGIALLAVVGLVAGEHLDVTVPVARGRVWRFAGSEVALAACVLYLPGPRLWAVALLAGLAVLAIGRHEGRSGRTVEYAVASFVASTGLAALVVASLIVLGTGRGLAAGAAVLAAGLLRHCLAAVAVALTSRRALIPLVRRRILGSGVFALGNGAIGVLAAELAATQPLGLTGLLVPVVLVVSSYEQQVRRAAQASLYAELARAQERAGERSVDASAGIVCTVAARMLGGADIEMLLHGADGLVRYLGDESGLRERRRTDPGALDAPWVLRLLASGGVRISRDVGRPECGVSIGRANAPVAFLSARRPAGAPAFTRREAALLRALAGQAEPWLARAVDADAADVDGLTGDADVLAEVREAARRVIASADIRRFDADDLVAELHGLERAVAQLVGSASPEAAEPAVGAEPALPAQRRSTDWTTTGRLPEERSA